MGPDPARADENRTTLAWMAVALLTVLGPGCSTAADRPPNPTTADQVTITGAVYSDFRIDLPCDEQMAGGSRPDTLSGVVLTFRDGTGATLGEAMTGALDVHPLTYGCRFYATYETTLTTATSYHVSFDPPEPETPFTGYFSGAESLRPQQIAHVELEADQFVWDFEALPEFVVP